MKPNVTLAVAAMVSLVCSVGPLLAGVWPMAGIFFSIAGIFFGFALMLTPLGGNPKRYTEKGTG